jgi:hypothetical protein
VIDGKERQSLASVKNLLPLPAASIASSIIEPVPSRYCGVWRRTLLQAPDLHDATTTVFWLQTSRWHADVRIPSARPDFSQTTSIADCNRQQLHWLAQQQGFAGMTEIDSTSQPEMCRWHRVADFHPPASMPDAGYMTFEPTRLTEIGVHAEYLEHWSRVADTESGFAVFQYEEDASQSSRFLMIAGDAVMHVRARSGDWPTKLPPDFDMTQLDDATLSAMLDFEISFGLRTASGWQIQHSTLPWLEQKYIAITLSSPVDDYIDMCWDGAWSRWHVLEWQPPMSA